MTNREKTVGYGFALLAASLWGLIPPVAKLAFREGIGPLELAFWRAALAGVCFALVAAARGQLALPARSEEGGADRWQTLAERLVFGLVGVALFYASYHWAVEAGGAALAAALLYTAPAQVATFGALFFAAPLTRRKGTAALLAVVGAAAVTLGGGGAGALSAGSLWAGAGWGVAASVCYAFYYLLGERFFREESPAAVYAWAFPFGALCLGLAGGVPSDLGLSLAGWGAVLLVALASTFGAYLAHGEALRRLDPTRVSIVTVLELVVAGGVAYLWWGERLGLLGWSGAVVILVAALLAVTERRASPPKREEAHAHRPLCHGSPCR